MKLLLLLTSFLTLAACSPKAQDVLETTVTETTESSSLPEQNSEEEMLFEVSVDSTDPEKAYETIYLHYSEKLANKADLLSEELLEDSQSQNEDHQNLEKVYQEKTDELAKIMAEASQAFSQVSIEDTDSGLANAEKWTDKLNEKSEHAIAQLESTYNNLTSEN
ncbi:hypothetical protein HZY91_08555 [Facklamia sp. DSM 111018]|uniref:DUF5105 domain-containing protein n=1 Tax=Facklamia lactis TaxID=2749967 RepID=A0ABS0LSB0_9LACT|nr:hypothetical protein [Facklamia lactis]MBG9981136.1 hypothetical protein [Facklamia lactis]MBG9986937.1 hypothetical protein [Facklamia lactis]